MHKYSGFINTLKPNQIFVFGSNIQGMHAGGAAKLAHEKFGAIMGTGYGFAHSTFAIPTIDFESKEMVLPIENIASYVDQFEIDVRNHPELVFMITDIGCGIAGYSPEEIAPLFNKFKNIDNVYISETFYNILNKQE